MTPTLAPRNTSSSPSAKGSSNTARRRRASASTSSTLGDVAAHDRELVAAEAREPVAGAQHAVEAARRSREQLVAGLVAEAVVHDLEVIEVEEHEADARVVGARGERVLQPLDEHHAVRQLGQRIVTGAVRELGLDAAVLAHVVRGTDELLADAVGADHRGDVDRDPAPAG